MVEGDEVENNFDVERFTSLITPTESDERRSRARVEQVLSSEVAKSEKVLAAVEKIRSLTQDARSVKTRLVHELEQMDPHVKEYMKQRANLTQRLRNIVLEPQLPVDRLTEFLEENGSSLGERYTNEVARVRLDIAISNTRNLSKDTQELLAKMEDDGFMWKEVVEKFNIPEEVVDNMDSLVQQIEVQGIIESLDIVRDEKSEHFSRTELTAIRAVLLEKIGQNVFSGEVLWQIIEGKYDRDDPYIYESVLNSYMEFQVAAAESRARLSRKAKIILSLLIAATAGMLLYSHKDQLKDALDKTTHTQVQDYQGNNVGSQTDGGGTGVGTGTGSGTGSGQDGGGTGVGTGQDGAGSGSGEGGSGSGSGSGGDGHEVSSDLHPSKEQELSSREIWHIEGEIPEVYFRQSSKSDFNSAYNEWFTSGAGYAFSSQLSEEDVTTTIRSAFTLSGDREYLRIPVPIGYEPVTVGFNSPDVNYAIIKYDTGEYVLRVQSDLGFETGITVGFAKSINLIEENNTASNDWSELIGNPDQLQVDVRMVLDNIRDSNLTPVQKAEAVRDYIKNSFTYSLDPSYSSYYAGLGIDGEYVRRAFEEKHGDCDVVNTIVVASLRYVGLSARLGEGFANGQNLLDKSSESLEEGEAHGWAEMYDESTQRWLVMDGTPTEVDDYSRDKLEKYNGGKGIDSVRIPASIDELKRMLHYMMQGVKDANTKTEGGVDVLMILLALATLYATPLILKRKLYDKVDQQFRRVDRQNTGKTWEKPFEDYAIYRMRRYLDRWVNIDADGCTSFVLQGIIGFTLVPEWSKYFIGLYKTRGVMAKMGEQKREGTEIEAFDPQQQELSEYVERVLGIDAEKIISISVKDRVKLMLSGIESAVIMQLSDKFEGGLFDSADFWENQPLAKIARKTQSETDFVEQVVNRLYKEYLDRYESEIFEREEAKKKGKKIRTSKRSFLVPLGTEPLRLDQFISVIGSTFDELLVYWRVKRAPKEEYRVQNPAFPETLDEETEPQIIQGTGMTLEQLITSAVKEKNNPPSPQA